MDLLEVDFRLRVRENGKEIPSRTSRGGGSLGESPEVEVLSWICNYRFQLRDLGLGRKGVPPTVTYTYSRRTNYTRYTRSVRSLSGTWVYFTLHFITHIYTERRKPTSINYHK